MMFIRITFLFSSFLFGSLGASADGVGPAVQIWHSFDGQKFHMRSSFAPSKLETWFRFTTLKDGFNGVSAEHEKDFKELIGRNGIYTIRVSSDPYNAEAGYLTASVPVCDLFKYGFREEIILHFNSDSTAVSGLEYTATPTPMTRTCDAEKVVAPVAFQTKVKEAERVSAQVVPLIAPGPRPPYLSNVKLAVAGNDVNDGTNTPKQQSFLTKYWYFVLPLVIIFLFGGGGGADQPAAAGGPASASK